MNYQNNSYNNLKCIWMAGNLVDYKLCDKNFECDNCQFDKAMRNTSFRQNQDDRIGVSKIENTIQQLIDNIGKEELKRDYFYLNSHLLLKNLFSNTYYIGFTPLANYILDNSFNIEYCNENDKVKTGQVLFRVKGEWGSVEISSPLDFTLLGKFTSEDNQTNNENWFGLLEADRNDVNASVIAGEFYLKDILSITRELSKIKLYYDEVGTTMLDGGTYLNNLGKIIGSEKYLSILKLLFTKKIK